MKKMSKGMLMTALICGAVYLGGSPVYANELQEFALEEYVVTAARTETKLVDTPANISVVDAQTIEERHYQDVSEVLKDVPGANVIDTGAGAYEKKIVLNGDERVLILVDGRRANLDMGTMTRSGFDMNQLPDVSLIERIEVLKGAGGALYGSDAVGGVINIITKKADRSFGKVSIGYGSMGAKDYNAVYSFKENKTGVSVAASKYEQDYYKYKDAKSDTTKRWPDKSDFKNEKVSLKIEQELTNDTSLELGYDYSKFEGFNPGSINNTASNYIDKKTENIYSKLNWSLRNNNPGYIQIYRNKYEYYNAGNLSEKTLGIDTQQTLNTSETNKLVVGISYRESEAVNDTSYFNDNYDVLEHNIDNLSMFINNIFEMSPSWSLNLGARYDKHSQAGSETTFSAGLNKKFDDNSHAYINWGQVFKAPTIDDLYYYIPGGTGAWGDYGAMIGDPNLKPETGETWTVGYSSKINAKTDWGINYFYSDLKDAISWAPESDAFDADWYVSNVYKQEKRGMELSINHHINDNVSLNASYTYLRVKDNGIRNYDYIPNTYRLGFKYNEGKWDSNVWLRLGNGADTMQLSSADGYIDNSYITVDLAVTYKATKDLSFYAKGYNLFNEAYAEQAGVSDGSYMYPAQSRRFIVGAEYKF